MSLFWYPAINRTRRFMNDKGEVDKAALIDSYILYQLDRLQSMFVYEGLPESIPAKWLEHYLLVDGHCAFVKVNDTLYAVTGGMGEEATPYYIPAGYVVANPWINTDGGTLSKTYWTETIKGHEQDAVLMRNDTYAVGIMPLLTRYCTQLAENDISMMIASILARATINISACDDRTKQSAELFIKRLYDGELSVISETAFIDSLNVREFTTVAQSLIPLIEYHQYIKASFFNDIGLNANYNMKRESLNSNESQLNDDMLRPLIDDMLAMRKEAVEEINKFFGTNISVDYNSAWLSNMIEEKAEIEAIEAEGNGESAAEELKIEEIPDAEIIETPEEEPIEEPETTEELTETVEELIEAVDELTEAVEDITEERSEDNESSENVE